MELVKVYKESLPAVRLVGKRYTGEDRDETGTFARYWQQCFHEDWPGLLKQCKGIPGVSDDLVGAMRMAGGEGDFEYWIGAFLAPDTTAPQGFDAVDIPAGQAGVCWLRGNDKSGELYGPQASDLAMGALAQQGWKFSDDGWFFERYNQERFTKPDEEGNVILDIGAYLV